MASQDHPRKPKPSRVAPPLVTANELSERFLRPRLDYTLSAPSTDLNEALSDLVCSRVPFEELSKRSPGGVDDLLKVQANLSLSSHAIRGVVQDLFDAVGETLMLPHARLVVSTRVLSDAMLFADAAFVLHVRADTKPKPALALLRSALECVGRAALIATGTGAEVDQFATATEREHRLHSGECLKALESLADRLVPGAAVRRLYDWLCSYSHYDAAAVFAEPALVDVYSTLALVTTLGARVAEVLVGGKPFVIVPTLPTDLPWLRPPGAVLEVVIADAAGNIIPPTK